MEHPRGIKPFGNSLTSGIPSIRSAGLGTLHVLNDDLLLSIMGQVPARDMARACAASKALYCFCTFEDAWKALVLEEFQGKFVWTGRWKETFAATCAATGSSLSAPAVGNGQLPGNGHQEQEQQQPRKKKQKKGKKKGEAEHRAAITSVPSKTLKVAGFYSDLLYQPWFCATLDMSPEWLEVDNIERRSNLSVQDFVDQFERPNRPVVLTDVVAKWPAMRKWTMQHLSEAFAGQDIIAGNYEMPFDTYMRYCADNTDEQPLYLFDKHFCKRAPQLARDFSVPQYFADDLFSVLGEHKRPDYRWLIIGPSRSGSTFHVDPNCTSAWNAVIEGTKRWVLYPPHVIPPGVHPSPDGADVATPLSIAEWYLNFYQEAREGKVKPLECTVRAGELLFVPRGWWHQAINLEPSIAITQNYVSRSGLPHVLAFLQPGRSDLVSGCSKDERMSLYERFVRALEEQKPDVLRELEQQRGAKRQKVEEQNKLSALFKFKAGGSTERQQDVEGQTQTAVPSGGACPQGAATASTPPAGFSFGFKL